MTTPIFKLLILIKRRPGMSTQEFRDYYENKHSKLGGDIGVTVGMIHYVRRYLEPLNGGDRRVQQAERRDHPAGSDDPGRTPQCVSRQAGFSIHARAPL
jgi:hypothetical protein